MATLIKKISKYALKILGKMRFTEKHKVDMLLRRITMVFIENDSVAKKSLVLAEFSSNTDFQKGSGSLSGPLAGFLFPSTSCLSCKGVLLAFLMAAMT